MRIEASLNKGAAERVNNRSEGAVPAIAMALGLEEAFRQFCSFGDGKLASSLMMDGAKFAKMCRDCKLLDKKLTATDVDIIFAKSKPKTERKLTFAQFEDAVKMLADKKYPGDPKGLEKIQSKLGEPTTHPGATKVANDEVLDRMTDTTKYTGSHKLRFDESGKGKGLDGRESVPKGPGYIPSLVSSQTSYVTGNRIGMDAVDSARAKDSPKAKAKAAAAVHSSPKPTPQKSTVAKASPRVQSKTGASSPAATKATSKTKTAAVVTNSPKASKPKGDIYNRLTDTSKYTGSHKHRFDDTGRGRGMEGRDSPAKGAAMTPPPASNLTPYVTGYKHENTYGK